MLQTALRHDDMLADGHRSQEFYSLNGAAVGEQMRVSARTLHQALNRLEQVIQQPRRVSAGEEQQLQELAKENQSLKSKAARLEQENASLKQDQGSMETLLAEQEEKNSAVSKQVLDLSVKLETLVARLAKVLEE